MDKHWGVKKPKIPRKAGAEASEKHISVQDNRIYFYSGVNRNSCVELNKKIGELESKSLTLSKTLGILPPSIKVFINSGGGSIVSGIASMDTMLRCKVPVETYVDGFSASAATFSHRLVYSHFFLFCFFLALGSEDIMRTIALVFLQ